MKRLLWMHVGGRPRVCRGNGYACVQDLCQECFQLLLQRVVSILSTVVDVSLCVFPYLCVCFLPLSMQMLAETMAAVGFEQSVKSVVPLIGPLAEVRFSSSEE